MPQTLRHDRHIVRPKAKKCPILRHFLQRLMPHAEEIHQLVTCEIWMPAHPRATSSIRTAVNLGTAMRRRPTVRMPLSASCRQVMSPSCSLPTCPPAVAQAATGAHARSCMRFPIILLPLIGVRSEQGAAGRTALATRLFAQVRLGRANRQDFGRGIRE